MEISSALGTSTVHIGVSPREWISKQNWQKHIFITDKNLHRLYKDFFNEASTIVIESGEKTKNLRTIEQIYHRLLELDADRTTVISGFGGGMICDITGFVASTYMRGLQFNLIPTSLLAQVDASIGGKNGVNLSEYKNIIGTFSQPKHIFLDFDLLKSLSKKEIASGLTEIIKHALIADSALFSYIEKKSAELLYLEPNIIEMPVLESIKIKSEIVKSDAREGGERRKLNFGHTFGHAFEKIYGLTHGEAVSMGMIIANKISVSMGLLTKHDENRIIALLKQLKLPTNLHLHKPKLIDAIKKDKKREGDLVHFVILSGIGKSKIVKLSYKNLEEFIHDLCES
jgi:3-dehydroquinate synthase